MRETTLNTKRPFWDETVEARVSATPMDSTPPSSGNIIECECGELLGKNEVCSTSDCSQMVSSFLGTDFTRKFAADIVGTALDNTWFHATIDPHWEETITKSDTPPVHIGTKEASEEVGILNAHCGYFLYEVTLKPETTVAPYLCPDTECAWAETMDVFYDMVGADFIGYVNLYESIGNVSLIGDGTQLQVLSKRWVPVLGEAECISYVEDVLGAKARFARPDMELDHEVKQLEQLLIFLTTAPVAA